MKPISYLQTDKRWADIDYSAKGESTTIGKSGCGPSCMAMVIASLKDSTVTPKETCAWAQNNGYKALNQGTYYSYFVPAGAAYGINIIKVNKTNVYGVKSTAVREANEKVITALKSGNWVIACMGKGNWTQSGHYVLAYSVEENKVLINDPGSTKAGRIRADIELWQSQVKYYWIVEVGSSNEEEEAVVVRYEKLKDIPNNVGFRDIIEILMNAKIINGDGSDTSGNNDVIDLSLDQVRTFVMLYRGGAFDRKLIEMGMKPAVKI
ncbi:MAG: C39 family peptidase [Aminipila sp.]